MSLLEQNTIIKKQVDEKATKLIKLDAVNN